MNDTNVASLNDEAHLHKISKNEKIIKHRTIKGVDETDDKPGKKS